jgi:6-pyruvoyltetrahydropterin/6-carboxytetrahydropterin synthase
VEVTGSHTQDGWVVDKGDITSVIDDWDHRFLLENDDPLIDAFEQSGDGDSLVVLEHPPTAEVMELVLERKLLETLPESVSDISVAVRETSEICAGATH